MKARKKELNHELLRVSLQKLNEEENNSIEAIQERSGVYNVWRIINAKTKPYLDKWCALHKAYPLTIPEPEYMDGSKVFSDKVFSDNTSQVINAKKGKQGNLANVMTFNENKLVSQVSPEEQSFLNLLQKLDTTGKYLRKFTRELMELMDKEDDETR